MLARQAEPSYRHCFRVEPCVHISLIRPLPGFVVHRKNDIDVAGFLQCVAGDLAGDRGRRFAVDRCDDQRVGLDAADTVRKAFASEQTRTQRRQSDVENLSGEPSAFLTFSPTQTPMS